MPEAVGRFRERFPEVGLRLRGAGRAEVLRLLDAGDSELHCGAVDDRKRLPDHLRCEPLDYADKLPPRPWYIFAPPVHFCSAVYTLAPFFLSRTTNWSSQGET